VLIDGAVDRRAASSPDVSDGLVMATGAVLDHELEQVVLQTRDAVELVRLPLAAPDTQALELTPGFVLSAEAEQIAQLLDEHPEASALRIPGALPERFLRSLLHPLAHRHRALAVLVSDPTKVFLWKRGPEWFERQGVHLQALARISLEALTVNPVAPESHRFDSAQLRDLLGSSIPDVPIFDVLHADYRGVSLTAP
jgi:hypothetical protein